MALSGSEAAAVMVMSAGSVKDELFAGLTIATEGGELLIAPVFPIISMLKLMSLLTRVA